MKDYIFNGVDQFCTKKMRIYAHFHVLKFQQNSRLICTCRRKILLSLFCTGGSSCSCCGCGKTKFTPSLLDFDWSLI